VSVAIAPQSVGLLAGRAGVMLSARRLGLRRNPAVNLVLDGWALHPSIWEYEWSSTAEYEAVRWRTAGG
jgi:hypothetical protein